MLILAPMQGLTELLFRKVYNDCFPGAFDLAVSPFLSLTHGNLKDALKKVSDVLPEANVGSIPVVPQILGHEVPEFVELANRLFELGYSEVNWNIGCPMRRVAGKHRGSGILPYPDEVHQVLEGVVPNIRPQLSVKMRLGYNSPDEIFRLIPILNDYPLKSITLHPRTGRQQYSGVPDMESFAKVYPLINHPVIYNGDICSVADYNRIRTTYPAITDVMIGRGALYNPFLPLQIKQMPCSPQQKAMFVDSLIQAILARPIPQASKVRKIKEYWCLVSKAFPIAEEQRCKVLHAADLDDMLRLISDMTK